jgi:hypothetical protein
VEGLPFGGSAKAIEVIGSGVDTANVAESPRTSQAPFGADCRKSVADRNGKDVRLDCADVGGQDKGVPRLRLLLGEQAREFLPVLECAVRQYRIGAEADREGDDVPGDVDLAAGRRAPDLEIRAQLHAYRDRGEQEIDLVRGADAHPDLADEVEGLPVEEKVRLGGQPGAKVAAVEDDVELAAAHRAGWGKGEIGGALDGKVVVDLPAEAEPLLVRIMQRLVKGGMISAERDHEVSGVIALEPNPECEAARQVAVLRQQIGIGREDRTPPRKAVRRAKHHLETELGISEFGAALPELDPDTPSK